jgi:hypothetical protein
MAVSELPSTIPGGRTPVCSECGVALCWDIPDNQYEEEQAFWDAWKCNECNPNYAGALRRWRRKNDLPVDVV